MVAAEFALLDWGVASNPDHDLGTDLWLMARNDRRFDLGLLVGAQVKTSENSDPSSYFKSPVHEGGVHTGWWFQDDEQDHVRAWLDHSIPHIVVLYDLRERKGYWGHVTTGTVEWTPKGGKVFIPKSQTVGPECLEQLLSVATSQRGTSGWEGSAWTGISSVAPLDEVRYALISPRLIAPHPNAPLKTATPAQAIATLVLGRLDRLNRRAALDALDQIERASKKNKKSTDPFKTVEEARSSDDWKWQLYAAIDSYLREGDIDELQDAVDAAMKKATSPGRKHPEVWSRLAATAAVSAAVMVELGRPEEALPVLEKALRPDRAAPVDHGWLQIQKARVLRELGRTKEARDLALTVQPLRAHAPGDPTALAIAAAAAQLVFLTTGWESKDIPKVVTESDTAAGWWRSQTLAGGLAKSFNKSFEQWADETPLNTSDDTSRYNLRAASFISGVTGDHSSWKQEYALLAKHHLEGTTRNSPASEVASALTRLRLAGDRMGLEAALKRVLRSGPAEAAKLAGSEIELSQTTVTSSLSDLDFITKAADVLATPEADAHAEWALGVLEDSTSFSERVKPTYHVLIFVLKMLSSLTRATSPGVRRKILDHVISLPPQVDQTTSTDYGTLALCLDREDLSEADLARIASRTGDDWELATAFDTLVADEENTKTKVMDEALRGSLDALIKLDDDSVDSLGSDAVQAQADALKKAIKQQYAETAGFNYDVSQPSYLGRELTRLYMRHPQYAEWEVLESLLNDPTVPSGRIAGILELVCRFPARVPPEVADRLQPICRSIQAREPGPMDLVVVQGLAAEALDALFPGDLSDAELWALMAGGTQQRMSLSRLIERRRDAQQFNVLACLCHDSDTDVRASAAFCVARWAAADVASPSSQLLLMRILEDSGTLLARDVALGLRVEQPHRSDMSGVLQKLRDHNSSQVRRLADRQTGRE